MTIGLVTLVSACGLKRNLELPNGKNSGGAQSSKASQTATPAAAPAPTPSPTPSPTPAPAPAPTRDPALTGS